MHRFDEQFILREANQKMQMNEARAAMDAALKELKRSQPSVRQRLARALIALAVRLEPGRYPVRREHKRT